MSIPASAIQPVCALDRDLFPPGFTFGASSSAFQYEGAAKEDGRGPSIWDTYCTEKGLLVGNAIDQYHRYKEDIAIMKWMGLDAYRFSISWSRILPNGKKSGGLNREGVKYYNDLIDELHANGMKPYVTLFHWDVPQALEDEYGGFLSREIIEDFKDYADLCFVEFGKKVKHWITLNEPWTFTQGGYATGTLAPGRGDVSDTTTSDRTRTLLPPTVVSFNPIRPHTSGNPAIEPYLVAHHLLLAHATVVQLYKTKYQKYQGGEIGLALNSLWVEPLNPSSKKDVEAQNRSLDFMLNLFLDPVLFGQYPTPVQAVMRERNIPMFSRDESSMMRNNPLDFLGINYYTASYVRDASHVPIEGNPSYMTDPKVEYPPKFLLGDDWGAIDWQKIYPEGIRDLLWYIKSKYPGPIYITENGYGEKRDDTLLLHEILHDEKRVSFHHQHLCYLIEAIKMFKVDVRGYFSWSLMDNFEWGSSFTCCFGNIYIDLKDDLKRYPKFSAQWFKFILQKNKKSSGGLFDTSKIGAHILKLGLTHEPLKLENGSVEDGDSLEANKDHGSDVNSDLALESVEDPIKSA